MQRSHNSFLVLGAAVVLGFAGAAKCEESANVAARVPAPLAPFTFKHLCVRMCDCGKTMCGIKCPLPAFTCRDDYCPKPLPRVPLCWPKGCCDDYCPKPLPCWPPNPCACRPCNAGVIHEKDAKTELQ
jgi:hypothetical protein